MNKLRLGVFLSLGLLISTCNSAAPAGSNSTKERTFALREDGSILIDLSSSTLAAEGKTFSLSAPLFPLTSILTAYLGPRFVTNEGAKQSLALATSIPFYYLLNLCKLNYADYNQIKVPQPSFLENPVALTKEEIITNYNLTQKCSAIKFTSQPYLIPQLIQDIDVCAEVLGGSWRMLKVDDINKLQAADYQKLADTLKAVKGSASSTAELYFSLLVYVYDENNQLKLVNLDPKDSHTLQDLPSGQDFKQPLASVNNIPVALRCIEGL